MISIIADYFLIGLVFIYLIIGSVTDIKKREVPNWISFSLIFIALFTRFLASLITKDFSYLYIALIAFGLILVISLALYFIRMISFGDVKILSGIALALGTITKDVGFFEGLFPYSNYLILQFFFNILIIGIVYGILFVIILAIKNRKKFVGGIKNFLGKAINKIIFISGIVLSILILIFYFVFNISYGWLFSILFLVFSLLFLLTKAVDSFCFLKYKKIKEVTEGEWIQEKIIIKGKPLKINKEGITEKQLKILKENKNQEDKILIKEGIPFVPVFLISLIATFLFGNLLIKLISLIVF